MPQQTTGSGQPVRNEDPGLLAGLLGIRTDEIDRVRGLFAASFVLGCGLVLFYGSANAIFLTRYDITVLPWVYIANAVAVIGVGLGYGAWSARVSPGKALVALAGAMTVSVAVLWGWARLSDSGVVAFVMAMWFRMLFIFAVLGLWEIASAVFDIRQAKRLFPAVALGMMIAFVVGGAATPVLSSLVGTVNLVGVASVFLAVYTVQFYRLLTRHRVGAAHEASVAPAGPVEILGDRYSRRMVWMKTVTILLMYLTEYVFYEQAAATFDSESSLAGFLGLFMGAMTVLMVVVTAFVSGRYISRFGIRVSTMTLPVGMLLIALPAGLYGTFAAIDSAFFVLVCVALATNHVLGNAIAEPAGAVLFQPMPHQRRMRVRLAVHGWLGSVALLLSGVLLLLINAAHLDSVAPLLFLVSAVGVVGVFVAALQYRDYLRTLQAATTLGFAADPDDTDDRALERLDLLDRSYLHDGFGADGPGAALAGASMLRSMGDDPLGPVLPALLDHSEPHLVGLALGSLTERGDLGQVTLLERAVERRDLPVTTRAQALAALALAEPGNADARTRAVLDGPTPEAAIPAALGDPALRASASMQLGRLVRSGAPADRVSAAQALAASSVVSGEGDPLDQFLCELLSDSDPTVLRAALVSARGRMTTTVAERVVRHAGDPLLRRAAIDALAAGQDDVVFAVDRVLDDLPDEVATDLVRRVVGPRVDDEEIIRRCLGPNSPSVLRHAGYETLRDGRTADRPAPAVGAHLRADLDLAAYLVAVHRDIAESAPIVADALADEFHAARRSVFAAISVDHDHRRVSDIEALYRSGAEDDRANAIEALDVLLAADHHRAVIAVIEPADIAEAALLIPGLRAVHHADVCLSELAADPRMTRWTRRVAALQLEHTPAPDGGSRMDQSTARVLALRRVDIFSRLSFDSLVELADAVSVQTVPAGAVIVEAGAVGQELFALVRGTVEVRTEEGRVRRLDEGTVFGELAILDPAPRSASVRALSEVEVLVVSRSTVLALAERRPAVMVEIARVLARRLRTAPELVT